ncbi:MAG: TraR/DksA family transcriptional regulator [Oligoflexia bacterium]|nr:TraR/DksA family transcriptional regulator [Oligoflexia bacterium]
MSLRKEKLSSVRKVLLQRREVLAGGLRRSTADLIEDEPSYSDSIDQASADTDKTFAVLLKNREHDMMRQIDAALRRIESGEFGECLRCGEEISEARLQAFPFTTLCIDCQSEVESEQRRAPNRAE